MVLFIIVYGLNSGLLLCVLVMLVSISGKCGLV